VITITAFRWVPPAVQGLVRDLRVRWALEEAGLPYHARLIGPDVQASADYRARQPFGQVPTFEEDGLALFESGAILLHIGTRSDVLLPTDATGKARAIAWLFAALNTMEVVTEQLAGLDLFFADQDWAKLRRPGVEGAVRRRLGELAAWLGERDYLEGRFTVGDLTMTTVLRALRHTDLLDAEPALEAYRERCESRPAFRKALADHLAPFEGRAA